MPTKVPAEGPSNARIMIVGEAPGAQEVEQGRPFVGASGQLLFSNGSGGFEAGMMAKAGIRRAECFVTNVCKYQPPGNDMEVWLTDKKKNAARDGLQHFRHGRWYNDLVQEGLHELEDEIEQVHPEVILAFGNTALWALTGEWSVSKWRGSELWYTGATYGPVPLIPTLHPASVLRQYSERAIVELDIAKRAVGKMATPDARREPQWRFQHTPTFEEACACLERLTGLGTPPWLSVDIETKWERIACVGFAWSDVDAICIPLMHVRGARWWTVEEEAHICMLMKRVLLHPHIRVLGQNINYDRQYIKADACLGVDVPVAFDTGIAQHLLYPGTPKDLARLASIYCPWYVYWKDEGQGLEDDTDEERWWFYNCRDTTATYAVAMLQMDALRRAGLWK